MKIKINNLISLYNFQFKRLFTTWTSLFIFFGPISLLVLTAFVIDPQSLMYLLMGVGISATSFFQFGNTYREWKNNKIINNNMKFTNHDVVLTVIAFISFSVLLSIIAVFAYLGMAFLFFGVWNIGKHIDTSLITGDFYNWSFITYVTSLSIFVSIAVAYLFESLTKRSSSYAILAILYMILIIFGSGFMNTISPSLSEHVSHTWVRSFQFLIPHWYINYFVLSVFSTNGTLDMNQILRLNNDIYYNLSLIIPWIYSFFIYIVAIIINIFRFNIK